MSVKPQIILAEEAITRSIVGAFYEVYNILRFGFSESVYKAALGRELIARGHIVAREVSVRVFYKGEAIAWQRVDMIVDNRVIVETKATFLLSPTARPQLQNYLRATNLRVGLLLHFGPRAEFFREYSPNVNESSR